MPRGGTKYIQGCGGSRYLADMGALTTIVSTGGLHETTNPRQGRETTGASSSSALKCKRGGHAANRGAVESSYVSTEGGGKCARCSLLRIQQGACTQAEPAGAAVQLEEGQQLVHGMLKCWGFCEQPMAYWCFEIMKYSEQIESF